MNERRAPKFTERLSMFMVVVAALGGGLVLLDPIITLNVIGGHVVKLGGEGFSADLKGAVVSLILIGGWTAVKEFWLGASASGVQQGEALSRAINTAAAPAPDGRFPRDLLGDQPTNTKTEEVKVTTTTTATGEGAAPAAQPEKGSTP